MALWLIVVITVLYAMSAIDLAFINGSWPMGLVFGGYALANIGLIVMMMPSK